MKKIIAILVLSLSLVACGLVSATGSVVGGTIKAVGTVTGAVIKTTGKIIGSGLPIIPSNNVPMSMKNQSIIGHWMRLMSRLAVFGG